MAYDRYDTRDAPRGDRSRWSSDRYENRDRGRRDERGFFERAGDEIASWFGDDDADRRRQQDRPYGQRESGSWSGDRDRYPERDQDRSRHSRDDNFGRDYGRRAAASDRGSSWRQEPRGENRDWSRQDREFENRGGDYDRDRRYRPMTGDYGRSEQYLAGGGGGRDEHRDFERGSRFERDRSQSEWGRDPYRQTSRAGTSDWSDRSRHEDPHYDSWRNRHMGELDRDYDDFRRENQSRFEDDFAGWREKRQQKRGLLGQIREHMEVVGNDEKHVGTVDKAAGDRLILTKSDPESGGSHHSLSCSDIDRIEGERVILDCSADQAKQNWRDESRNRALFEREDSGEIGPRVLDRSFEGTYRR